MGAHHAHHARLALAAVTAVGVSAFLLGANTKTASTLPAPAVHQSAASAIAHHSVSTAAHRTDSAAMRRAVTSSARPLAVTVTATEFKLAPSPLRVEVGRPVRLTFVNKGVAIHNWTVQGLQAGQVRVLARPSDLAASLAQEMMASIARGIPFAEANPGERAVVTFTPLRVGTYTTYCTIPGHKQMGMAGQLIVTGPSGSSSSTRHAASVAPASQPSRQVPSHARQDAAKPVARLPLPRVAPPVGTRGPRLVHVTLEAKEVTAYLDDGVAYHFWTFNGTVPGPMIRVRVGDTVAVTLKNAPGSMMSHSIDLHAVSGPGGGSVATNVAPGQMAAFTFKALQPGVYVYHCATAPVAEHISNGMYGLIVVEPARGLPRVGREFYVMEGELYTQGTGSGRFALPRLLAEDPSYVIFNGGVGALMGRHALQAKVGETVRLFFGDGGPNLTASLHVIGAIFDRVAPEGSFDWAHNVAVTLVPAGGATIAEFTPREPGDYMIVDHSLSRALQGGVAVIHVAGAVDPAIFKPAPGDHIMQSMTH